MKKIITSIAVLLAAGFVNQAEAQSVAINSTGNVADTSALLDLTSTAKGILVPRMTSTQRLAIYQPATGLMVFQTDAPAGFYYNSGTAGSPSWTLMQTSLANVTTQGNTFNGASQLVQMTASTKLPAVDGSALTNLTASNLSTGTVPDARLSSNVTLQGNTFNAASKLVQLDGSAKLPAVDGSQLTNLPAGTAAVDFMTLAGTTGTITASSARTIIINLSGQSGTPLQVTMNLPLPSAYTSGTVLNIGFINYGSQPSVIYSSSSNIIAASGSPGTTYTVSYSAGVVSFVTNGTNWYRF